MSERKYGFIGLGAQGAPIARRMIDAGLPVALWARRPETLEAVGAGQHAKLLNNSLMAANMGLAYRTLQAAALLGDALATSDNFTIIECASRAFLDPALQTASMTISGT